MQKLLSYIFINKIESEYRHNRTPRASSSRKLKQFKRLSRSDAQKYMKQLDNEEMKASRQKSQQARG